MPELPDGFQEFKQKYPDYFPEGSELQKQIDVYLTIKKIQTDNKMVRAAVFQKLDEAVLNKGKEKPAESFIPNFVYYKENKDGTKIVKFDFVLFSTYLTDLLHIMYFNKTFYIYDGEKHIYKKQTNQIETQIRDTYIEYFLNGSLLELTKEVLAHLRAMGSSDEFPFNNSANTIPVENGIVKIDYETGEIRLLPHGPEHLFTYKLNIKYDPGVKPCKAIPLLKRMVEPENVMALVQIFAQAILQMQTGNAYKKAYLLQGEPNAGKTSYLKFLYRMVAQDYVSSISLQQLCEDKFSGGNLEGKIFNIYDELEDVPLTVIDQFKTFTGDCRHGVERKFEGKYTGKLSAVHIFTCNYPPSYPDKVRRDTAFWTRWEYIKFPFQYPTNPRFYDEWYTEENISAYFNLVLGAMLYIRKNKLIANTDIQVVMNNWSINSDPMFDFITYMFAPAPTKGEKRYFSKAKLYAAYLNWCNDEKIPEHRRLGSLKSFTISLQSKDILPERKKIRGENYEIYYTTAYIQRIQNPLIDLDFQTEGGGLIA
ncbi:MAG: DUF5906 domain-containing protein [Smithella sp.]